MLGGGRGRGGRERMKCQEGEKKRGEGRRKSCGPD